jgi:hypothetical protein
MKERGGKHDYVLKRTYLLRIEDEETTHMYMQKYM